MTEHHHENLSIDENDEDLEDTPILDPKAKRQFIAVSSVSKELFEETRRKDEEIKKSPNFLKARQKAIEYLQEQEKKEKQAN